MFFLWYKSCIFDENSEWLRYFYSILTETIARFNEICFRVLKYILVHFSIYLCSYIYVIWSISPEIIKLQKLFFRSMRLLHDNSNEDKVISTKNFFEEIRYAIVFLFQSS